MEVRENTAHVNGQQLLAKVVYFSGGRTSGYMLRLLMDKHPDFKDRFIVVFANTGKEMPKTLEFVHQVELEWNIPIAWVEYRRVPAASIPVDPFPTARRNQNLAKARLNNENIHWFAKVDFETASRNGEPFDALLTWAKALPNVINRTCSAELKLRAIMRYLFSLGIKELDSFVGIRKDEAHRSIEILRGCSSFEHPQFPLIEANVNVEDVNRFWMEQSFDLGLDHLEGNCDFCFLKAKWKRVEMARRYPERLRWWEGKEEEKKHYLGAGKLFHMNEPYSLIRELSVAPQQAELFSSTQDIPCSCAEKGFTEQGEDEL